MRYKNKNGLTPDDLKQALKQFKQHKSFDQDSVPKVSRNKVSTKFLNYSNTPSPTVYGPYSLPIVSSAFSHLEPCSLPNIFRFLSSWALLFPFLSFWALRPLHFIFTFLSSWALLSTHPIVSSPFSHLGPCSPPTLIVSSPFSRIGPCSLPIVSSPFSHLGPYSLPIFSPAFSCLGPCCLLIVLSSFSRFGPCALPIVSSFFFFPLFLSPSKVAMFLFQCNTPFLFS